jgi:hypothetical protein
VGTAQARLCPPYEDSASCFARHHEIFVRARLNHHSSSAIHAPGAKFHVRSGAIGGEPPRIASHERDHLMKFLAASALTLGLGLFAMTSSQAMPLAPLGQTAANDAVITVSGGCGWGWHRGPFGGCRPAYNCPPGWHSGPYGQRCFRNW